MGDVGRDGVERRDHAVPADQDHVQDNEDAQQHGQEHHVPEQHLAGVEHIEGGADSDSVEPVLP